MPTIPNHPKSDVFCHKVTLYVTFEDSPALAVSASDDGIMDGIRKWGGDKIYTKHTHTTSIDVTGSYIERLNWSNVAAQHGFWSSAMGLDRA